MSQKGGAWKVAYADFITAMMAFFMVMWILGTEQEALDQIQQYFRNPPSPFDRQAGRFAAEMGEFSGRVSNEANEEFFDRADPAVLLAIAHEFARLLNLQGQQESASPVEITIVDDGLRLVVFDRSDVPLFPDYEMQLTEWGDFLIQNLSWLISRYDFEVVIGTHSGERDMAKAHQAPPDFGIWELTTERAHVLRRRLQHFANNELAIKRLSGYGVEAPLNGANALRTNQRVEISLSFARGAHATMQTLPNIQPQ